MFIKFSSLLCSTHFLLLVAALPTTDRSETSTLANKIYEPIEVDIGKLYTSEDLARLFDARSTGSLVQTRSEHESMVNSELRNRPVDMISAIDFQYRSTCAHGNPIVRRFKVLATFDGNNAHYDKMNSLNIDGYNSVTMSGGLGKPFISTAEYHHASCHAIDPYTFCSYYHSGSVTATITVLGKSPGMKLSTTEPGQGTPLQRPYVIQTCSHVIPSKDRPAVPCPVLDLKRPRCKIDQWQYPNIL